LLLWFLKKLGDTAFVAEVFLRESKVGAQLFLMVDVGVRGLRGAADGADFEALGAAKSPVARGDALDEGFLDEGLGLKLGDEVGEEGVEIFAAFREVAGETTSLARRPCLRALRAERALPWGVAGPVDCRALCWLAAICLSETTLVMRGPSLST